MTLSIIVPILNEAAALPQMLVSLAPLRRQGCELIIADGGSSDGSWVLAEDAGCRVLAAPRGRARQLNAGAAVATGSTLLFLHADTTLPDGADRLIGAALASPGREWGRFDVRIAGRHPMLVVIGALMNRRSRWSGIATGDQAIFVRRGAFDAAGGFPNQPLMEDIELSIRLLRRSRPACIGAPVITSGRRWESRGVWRTIFLMWRLRWQYARGVPAQQLAEAYR